MLFNSVLYVIFLPVCVILYFSTPCRFRNIFLLAASYFFYMCWEPRYALLIAFSTLATWLCGFLVDRTERGNLRKAALAVNIAVNLGILFVFKYYNFFTFSLSRIAASVGLTLTLPSFSLLLPVGISFYTFQALGYSIDVYRGDILHERNYFNYALFVSFFPQLVAGPIERSMNLLPQFHARHNFSIPETVEGLRLILLGMFKKIVIADMMAMYVDGVFADIHRFSGWTLAAAVFFFTIQIYCDFSGYSDVARGSARIFGFTLMENFNAPYFSSSITEFWSRWHISLSTWFRDYLYIPLGGNRKGFFRKCINLMVVFLVSGLWHGASLSFIVWGGLHGCFRVVEELWRKCAKPLEFRYPWCYAVHRLIKTLSCFLLVSFAWIFFRADSVLIGLSVTRHILKSLLLESPRILKSELCTILLENYFYAEIFLLFILGIYALGLGFLFASDWRRISGKTPYKSGQNIRCWAMAVLVVFCYMVENAIFGQSGAFIYFQF